jgi:hypothetical protein
MLSWFDTRAVRSFGIELADYVVAQDKLLRQGSKKRALKADADLASSMTRRIAEFRASERLNVYKVAQLGAVFKERLGEAGLDEASIEALLTHLLVRARA